MKTMVEDKKKYIGSVAFVLVLIAVTYFALMRNHDLGQLVQIIADCKAGFLLGGVGMMLVFFACEALSLRTLLGSQGYRMPFRRCYSYALIDFYFSSVTPGCAAGQPAQLYYMSRDRIPLSASSLSLLVFNLCYHIAVVLVALTILLSFGTQLAALLGNLRFLLYIGFSIQSGLVLLFIAAIFSKRLLPAGVRLAVRLLTRLRLCKDGDALRAKAETQIDAYRQGADYLRHHPALLLKVMGLTLAHILSLYTIPFWIYLAFGLSGSSLLTIVAMQATLMLAIESVPIPAGVGLSEKVFLIVYGSMFGSTMVLPAMALYRGVSMYAFMIVGALAAFLCGRRAEPCTRSFPGSENPGAVRPIPVGLSPTPLFFRGSETRSAVRPIPQVSAGIATAGRKAARTPRPSRARLRRPVVLRLRRTAQ